MTQYERTMPCKNAGTDGGTCGIEIGLSAGKWYDVKSDIIHYKTCRYPREFKRRSSYPEKEQYNDSLRSEVAGLREELGKLRDAHVQLVKDVEKLQNA